MATSSVEGISDLTLVVSGLQFGKNAQDVLPGIRGIGGELFNIGAQSGIGIGQNGVPQSSTFLFDAEFLDIERVEVLKGPQGTINGRNSTGGTINVFSKMPTDKFEAGVKATVGNYDRRAAEVYVSGPITDKVGGRLALKTDRADGWIRNTYLDQRTASTDRISFRGTLVAELSDTVAATLIVDGLNDDSITQGLHSWGAIHPGYPSIMEYAGVETIDLDSLEFQTEQRYNNDKDRYAATLIVTWNLNPASTLTSTTGYIDHTNRTGWDSDGLTISTNNIPIIDFEIWQFTQELTLTADLTDRLDLILGGLYLREKAVEPIHFYSGSYIGLLPGIWAKPEDDLTSISGYAQLRYELTDKLRISVGVRHTNDEKKTKNQNFGLVGPEVQRYNDLGIRAPTSLMPDVSGTPKKTTFKATTPRAAIDYSLDDNVTFYVSASRGFKAGGFNTFQNTLTTDAFEPEFVWSYEAGAKARLLDNRVFVAGSVFFMDYESLQLNVFGIDGDFLPQVLNAGDAEISGLELELDAFVSDELRIRVAAAYLDAEMTKSRTADPIFPELGDVDPTTGLNVRDLAGNRLPRAPKWKIAVSGIYTKPLGNNLHGVLKADYMWQDHMFFNFYNHEALHQDSYGLLNLYAGLESAGGSWSLGAFVQNATDKRYFTQMNVDSIGTAPVPRPYVNIGEPRMYGLRFGYNF